jgi:predicted nucleic acid-binding protein
VNLVDSSAWLEYFADGPNAAFFAPAIEKSSDLLVPTIVVFEVYKRIREQRDQRAALEAVSALQQGRIIDLTVTLAIAAGGISHFEKLPMADSIIIATARAENAVIWTQDADFEKIKQVRFRAKKA